MLGFAAVNTGNNLLFLIVAALLAFMLVTGLLGRANLGRMALRLTLPGEVYAELPARATLTLSNRRRFLPLFLLEARLQEESVLFTLVRPGASQEHALPLSFPRRGRYRLPPVELASPFPVNFFRRFTRRELDQSVLVLPRPRPCALPAAASGRSARGEAASRRRGYEGDLLALSDYTGAEPLKLIHWKQSARQDALKVKELAAGLDQPLWVDLERCPGASLEERLGAAAYLINRFWRSGRPVGLRLAGRVVSPARGRAQRLRLLQELALYDPG